MLVFSKCADCEILPQDWTRADEPKESGPATWDALDVCRRELLAAQEHGAHPLGAE